MKCGKVAAIVFCLTFASGTSTWAQNGEVSRSVYSSGDRWRTSVPDGRNAEPLRAAFQTMLSTAAEATVRISGDGKPQALGAVVAADGYIVSKASLLEGTLTCHFANGKDYPAKVIATNEANDLALLHVEATNLTVAPWRQGGVAVGSFVAAVGCDPLVVGIVSSEPRRIENNGSSPPPKVWLGISVGTNSPTAVASVEPGSPAERAGVKVGDEIREIDGQTVRTAQSVVQEVAIHKSQEKIKLVVHRDHDDKELVAVLEKPKSVKSPNDAWGGGPFSERRWNFPLALPHDAPVRPRDCGGPLVDSDGRVVGVNIARALRVSTFALPADTVKSLVAEMRRQAKR